MATKKDKDPAKDDVQQIAPIGLDELTQVSGGQKQGEAPKRPSFGRVITGLLGNGE
jgi:hypothetical protein